MNRKHLGFTSALILLASILSLPAAAAQHDSPTNNQTRHQQQLESVLGNIGKATWISEGKGPHVIYVFFDPNCPYCHQLYLNTRDWIRDEKVELRWIPVGILTATSLDKAAAMLEAKNPLQAFYANEDHYSRSSGGGGLEGDIASPEVEAKLKDNAALLASAGTSAVPAMLFRAIDDTPILIQGSPPASKLPVILRNLK